MKKKKTVDAAFSVHASSSAGPLVCVTCCTVDQQVKMHDSAATHTIQLRSNQRLFAAASLTSVSSPESFPRGGKKKE